jgi:hypothetical protein
VLVGAVKQTQAASHSAMQATGLVETPVCRVQVSLKEELDPLGKLTTLEDLSTTCSGPILGSHAKALLPLTRLTSLQLTGGGAGSGEALARLTALTRLTALKLHFLSSLPPALMQGLTALRSLATLELWESAVDKAAAIADLAELRYLALPGVTKGGLTVPVLNLLSTLSNLIQLNVTENPALSAKDAKLRDFVRNHSAPNDRNKLAKWPEHHAALVKLVPRLGMLQCLVGLRSLQVMYVDGSAASAESIEVVKRLRLGRSVRIVANPH